MLDSGISLGRLTSGVRENVVDALVKQQHEREKIMKIQQFKYLHCSEDHEEGIILVDPETESIPVTDERGNVLYYCMGGQHVFSSDMNGLIMQSLLDDE
jgi:hypothetical protein